VCGKNNFRTIMPGPCGNHVRSCPLHRHLPGIHSVGPQFGAEKIPSCTFIRSNRFDVDQVACQPKQVHAAKEYQSLVPGRQPADSLQYYLGERLIVADEGRKTNEIPCHPKPPASAPYRSQARSDVWKLCLTPDPPPQPTLPWSVILIPSLAEHSTTKWSSTP
jgi:hypothetical protein